MTVLASIPEQSYTPRTINASPVIGAGVKSIRLTCSRVGWPAGQVGTISATRPDGTPCSSVGFSGGTAFKKDGVTIASESGMSIDNGGADLMAGTWAIKIEILQTVTTAVQIESTP